MTKDWYGHTFTVCDLGTRWSEAGGAYLFARFMGDDQWEPLALGTALNFMTQLTSSTEPSLLAKGQGATHVHVLMCDPGTAEEVARELKTKLRL